MRKSRAQRLSGYTILLVDDNPEYLEATRLLLEREGHSVMVAANGADALATLRQKPVDLLLLDYYMPGMTGEEVVTQLRQFNPYIQVILQTGYASEQPPRELLRRLDIQGYYDKTEGPDKLLMWTDAGLKSAYTIQMLYKSRQGLRYILDTTPDLHKIQPLDDLLQGILFQVAGLLGAVNSFLAVLPDDRIAGKPVEVESFVATMEDDMELAIRAGTGRFSGKRELGGLLEEDNVRQIVDALRQIQIQILDTVTIVPLRVGENAIGVVYLDRPAIVKEDVELLQIFANQAAVAIQNMQLYSMATLDPLTSSFARGFFDKWLLRELRTALRSQQPLTFLMVDLDGLKKVNDTAGHLAGDQALIALGKVLRQATRTTDIVGRYGGDEFAVVLPQSEGEGAGVVARRIVTLLKDKRVESPNGGLPLQVSIGLSTLVTAEFDPAGASPPHLPILLPADGGGADQERRRGPLSGQEGRRRARPSRRLHGMASRKGHGVLVNGSKGGASRRRRTVGFLAPDLSTPAAALIWRGITAAAQAQGDHVILFRGGELCSPFGLESQANLIYDLARSGRVDAVILWSAGVGRRVEDPVLEELCSRYLPVPVVSLEKALPGIPSVVIDMAGALSGLARHVSEHHGRRRTAFISDAEDGMKRLYADCFSRAGITITEPTPMTRWLKAERKKGALALVCPSAESASRIRAGAAEAGLRIPRDIALFLLDDAEAENGLSTLRLPYEGMGRTGMRLAHSALEKGGAAELTVLTPRFIPGPSCGCPAPARSQTAARRPEAPAFKEAAVRSVEASLLESSDTAAIMEIMTRRLPELGIRSCWLSLFENPGPYRYPQPAPVSSRMVLDMDRGKWNRRSDSGFPSRRLVPDHVWPPAGRRTLTVEPLRFQKNQIGFMLLETEPGREAYGARLSVFVSAALHGASMAGLEAKRLGQLQAAATVSRASSSILDPAHLLRHVVELITEHFGVARAGMYLMEEGGTA